MDSGVLVDFSRGTDWPGSSDDSYPQHSDELVVEELASSSVSCSDEVLCQRVESAVRKFTEDLIVCERRARDKLRSKRRRRDKLRVRFFLYVGPRGYYLVRVFRCGAGKEYLVRQVQFFLSKEWCRPFFYFLAC